MAIDSVTIGQKDKPREEHTLKRGEILPRPVSTHGMTHRLNTGCGKLYLTVNYQPDNGEIIETFITTGSDGGCLVYTEAASRMISLAIRGGIAVDEIVEQLLSTHSCPSYMLAKGKGRKLSPGKSCASAIAYKIAEIKDMLKKECNGSQGSTEEPIDPSLLCECGAIMECVEGCFVCRNCGYSNAASGGRHLPGNPGAGGSGDYAARSGEKGDRVEIWKARWYGEKYGRKTGT